MKDAIEFNSTNNHGSSNNNTTTKASKGNISNNQPSNVMNFSEEVRKTSLWKSITKSKDKEVTTSEKKSSRSSGIKKRIRRLSLGFRASDEDRSLVIVNNQQSPTIVIEPSNDEQQTQPTSLNKINSDLRM
ncbi:unnamed protein product [Rotaria magnacalcarata]|nr:unnamed protein product [Rotaria magnacalcarata]